MAELNDADRFEKARTAIGDAIGMLKKVSAPVGSSDSMMAMYALDYLGSAYSCLTPSTDNPAWSD